MSSRAPRRASRPRRRSRSTRGRGRRSRCCARLRRSCDFDWAGAERDIRRALELSPGSAVVHNEAAYLWSILGRHDEALRESRIAEQLDPLSEEIGVYSGHAAVRFARRFEEADPAAPEGARVHPGIGVREVGARQSPSRPSGATTRRSRSFSRARSPDPRPNFALGLTYGLAGRKDEARKVLDDASREAEVAVPPADADRDRLRGPRREGDGLGVAEAGVGRPGLARRRDGRRSALRRLPERPPLPGPAPEDEPAVRAVTSASRPPVRRPRPSGRGPGRDPSPRPSCRPASGRRPRRASRAAPRPMTIVRSLTER